MTSRIIPMLRICTAGGSDPEVMEVDDLDDSTEAVGDWPDVEDLCSSPKSPHGQHGYSETDGHHACIYCGAASELDR